MRASPPDEWTLLPGFCFATGDLAERSGVEIGIVDRVIATFALPDGDRNATFNSLHDFNLTNALPLLRWENGEFISFQQYSLLEALYESPFFWMTADKSYVSKALAHRGRFAEAFAGGRLRHVFGDVYVHPNVKIRKGKGKEVGEIDVLVLFGNRAIVLQAKAKRLTLEARKGNDLQLKDDFTKAIQDAYDQASECTSALMDPACSFIDESGHELKIPGALKRIYPVCIVADHYPALSFQARQFLEITETEIIAPPLVTDVFGLDTMAEMLDAPLLFLNYLDLRARFGEKLLATGELTLLGYHLQGNLWVDEKYDMAAIGDDVGVDLDIAMAVRRDGVPGEKTPKGILTHLKGTTAGRIIEKIEANPDPATIDFGLLLLQMGQDTITTVSKAIDKMAALALGDMSNHDFTMGLRSVSSGLTIHANFDDDQVAARRLRTHCVFRKYSEKAASWNGLVIDPVDASVRFGLRLDYPWKQDDRMDQRVGNLPKGRPGARFNLDRIQRNKIGRNAPCPCGSGKKYKKCCLQ